MKFKAVIDDKTGEVNISVSGAAPDGSVTQLESRLLSLAGALLVDARGRTVSFDSSAPEESAATSELTPALGTKIPQGEEKAYFDRTLAYRYAGLSRAATAAKLGLKKDCVAFKRLWLDATPDGGLLPVSPRQAVVEPGIVVLESPEERLK